MFGPDLRRLVVTAGIAGTAAHGGLDQPDTVAALSKIVELARSQDRAEIDVDSLHRYLLAEETLARHAWRFEDVLHALPFIESLAALPHSWHWTVVEEVMKGVASMMNADIDAPEVAKFIRRHQRFIEIGFNEEEAEAVAEALVRAGAVGQQRTRMLNRLVSVSVLREEEAQLDARIQRSKDQGEALS